MNIKISKTFLVFLTFLILFLNSQIIQAQSSADSLSKLLEKSSGNLKIDVFNKLSWELRNTDPQKALKYAQSALLLADLRGYETGKMKALSFAGVAEKNLGNYFNALTYYYEALKVAEIENSTADIAYSKINIGNIYIYQEEYREAINPLEEALEIAVELEDKSILAYANLNLGRAYSNLRENDKAFSYLHQSLQLRKQIKDSAAMSVCYKYIGDVHYSMNEFGKAKRLYFKSLGFENLAKEDKDLIADIYNKLARTYFKEGDFEKSIDFAEKSHFFANEIHSILRLRNACFTLYEVYKEKNSFENSLKYYQKYAVFKDSLINAQNIKKITQLAEKHKYEKEQNLRKIEEDKRKLIQLERLKQEKNKLIFMSVLLALSFVFILVVVRHNILKRKANNNLRQQRDTISKQNQEIKDSINYAARIQNAILPPLEEMSKVFSDNFILFLPRDIVSGDFYWTRALKVNGREHVIIIAADCTGHGVPGAFMSLLGIAFLNEIVNDAVEENKATANTILDKLREKLINSLHQTGKDEEAKDGMDMSLCMIDIESYTMQFSGAYNSIFIARNDELIKVKADRMPIGIYPRKTKNFSLKELKLYKDDRIYLFSDGFPDQFGGHDDSKFLIKNFRKLILENYKQPMDLQKEIFYKTLRTWQGDSEQIDDILVIGVNI